MSRVWIVRMKEGDHSKWGAWNMEHGVKVAQFSLINSTSPPGLPNVNLMLYWDFSVWRRNVVLESTVGWTRWDQDMTGGPWRASKNV